MKKGFSSGSRVSGLGLRAPLARPGELLPRPAGHAGGLRCELEGPLDLAVLGLVFRVLGGEGVRGSEGYVLRLR